jgi:hypothetical protein
MADGTIVLPPDSTGKALRTRDRGVAGHEQFIALGSLPTYSYWSGFTAAAAAARIDFDLFNASGSGRIIRVRKIFIYTNLAAVTGAASVFDIDRTSAVGTGGTVITANLMDTNDPAVPAQITARAIPTGGATKSGGSITQWGSWSEETLAPAAMDRFMNVMAEGPEVKELVLREGQGMAIRRTTAGAGAFGFFVVCCIE